MTKIYISSNNGSTTVSLNHKENYFMLGCFDFGIPNFTVCLTFSNYMESTTFWVSFTETMCLLWLF